MSADEPDDFETAGQFVVAFGRLSPREREVLSIIALDGLDNGEVAKKLGIATSTVETHRARGLLSIAQFMRRDSFRIRLFTSMWWKYIRPSMSKDQKHV